MVMGSLLGKNWAEGEVTSVNKYDVRSPAISAEDVKKRIAEIQGEPPDPYLVWPFHDAPQVYKDLSPHGGDEDWIAFVPDGQHDKNPPWAWGGFGISEVSEHEVGGGIILIGAHA